MQNECLAVFNWVKQGSVFKWIAGVLCIGNACSGEMSVSLCLDGVQRGSWRNTKPDPRWRHAGKGERRGKGIMCPILSGSSATTQNLLQSFFFFFTPFSRSAEQHGCCRVSPAKIIIKTTLPQTFTKAVVWSQGPIFFPLFWGGWGRRGVSGSK